MQDADKKLGVAPDPVRARPLRQQIKGQFLLSGKKLTITRREDVIRAEFKQQVVIENCEIDLRFARQDFGNVGIFLFACAEVTLRNIRIIGHTEGREASGGIRIWDADKIRIDDCFVQGTFDRENIELRDCGPATLRRTESRGRRLASGSFASGSGIWVANVRGESKMLPANPDRPRYPSSDLLIEDCRIADNTADNRNKDGIYIQSVRNFVVRRTRVENWRHDGLIDVGFRDTQGNKPNHGGKGRVEDCQFGNGYLKVTVGAAGGIRFVNCDCSGVSYVPYFFDGGDVFFEGCRFNTFMDARRADLPDAFAVNQQGDWIPDSQDKYGRASRTHFIRCSFRDTRPHSAFLLGNAKNPFLKFFVTDDNTYDLPGLASFARDQEATYATFEQWQRNTGNDRRSRWISVIPTTK